MKSLLRNIFIIFLGFAFISDISAKDSGTTSADKVTDARQRLDSCLADITNGNYIRALSNGYMFMNQMKNSPEGTFTNEEKARCLFYLGNVNYAFQNYNASIRYYVESSRIPLRGKDAELRKKIYHNLAIVSCITKDRGAAKNYIKILDGIPYRKDPSNEIYARQLRMAVYEKNFGDINKSISMMKKAYSFMKSKNLDSRLGLTPVSEIFEMYESMQQYDSAMLYLDRYYDLACRHNSSNMIVDATAGYMRLYSKMGNLEKSIEYQNKYFGIKDDLLNSSSFLELNRIHNEENQRISEQKIHNLEIRLSRQMVITWTVVIIAACAVLVWIFLSQRSRLRQAYRALYKRNQEIIRILDQHPDDDNSPTLTAEPESQTETAVKERINENVYQELESKINNIMTTGKEFLDPDFSISVLSSLVGYNTKYVSTFINDRYNKNFRAFINAYRIKEALTRFNDNSGEYRKMTIKAVAESVGFRSTSNFISAFKKETGLTPSMYLKLSDEEK